MAQKYYIFIGVSILAILAGIFSYPNYFNKGVEALNNKMSWTLPKFPEKAYVLGRQYFVDHRMEDALSEFDYAKNLIPSLQAFSDIDYWRGRVFEDLGKEGDTKISYMYFINYSERSMPEFFKVTYPDDPTWLEKAQDAQIRLKKIQVTNSFEKESLRQ